MVNGLVHLILASSVMGSAVKSDSYVNSKSTTNFYKFKSFNFSFILGFESKVLEFDQIVPPTLNRSEAASRFYNVLCLCTSGALKVSQSIPFHSIEIRVQ